ncbi:hypothetical protein HK102_001158 [Quaeritorhiza haematococci]|nr:hypothetical protein HK102_001158 [Quaeritorhiza haematococci]
MTLFKEQKAYSWLTAYRAIPALLWTLLKLLGINTFVKQVLSYKQIQTLASKKYNFKSVYGKSEMISAKLSAVLLFLAAAASSSIPTTNATPAPVPQGDPSQVQSPIDFLFIARGVCRKTGQNGDAVMTRFCNGVLQGGDPDVGGNRGRDQDNINRINNRGQLRALAQAKCRDKQTPPGNLLFRFNNCRFARNDARQEAIRQLCISVDGEGDVCGRLGVPVNRI